MKRRKNHFRLGITAAVLTAALLPLPAFGQEEPAAVPSGIETQGLRAARETERPVSSAPETATSAPVVSDAGISGPAVSAPVPPPAAGGESVPADVAGKSYETAVRGLIAEGIVTGDTDGLFYPEQTLTRAQACIMVVKTMAPPDRDLLGTATQPAGGGGFSDMAGYGWAEAYVNYGVKKGIVKGYPDGRFRAGNPVTVHELSALLLRAAGVSESSLSGVWPENYIRGAEARGLYREVGDPGALPREAKKWMAARMTWNAMEMIRKAAAEPLTPPVSGTPETLPDFKGFDYTAKGSFNGDLTRFFGLPVSERAVVWTFGETASYAEEMTFSAVKTDYRMDSVYKYKNTVTPARYQTENGVVVRLLLPRDAGYTGTVYGVINDTRQEIETLTAGRQIFWEKTEAVKGVPEASGKGGGFLSGIVYRMKTENGKIKEIESLDDAGNGYHKLEAYDPEENSLQVSSGAESLRFFLNRDCTLYAIEEKNQSRYRPGNRSELKKGVSVRLYDLSYESEGIEMVIIRN